VTVTGSSGFSSASSVTIAVISLVSEAIGNFDSMFLAEENFADSGSTTSRGCDSAPVGAAPRASTGVEPTASAIRISR